MRRRRHARARVERHAGAARDARGAHDARRGAARHPIDRPAPRAFGRRTALLLGALVAVVATACLGARALRPTASAGTAVTATAPSGATFSPALAEYEDDALAADSAPPAPDGDGALAYAGRDAHHRPRYVGRAFSPDERRLLRDAFGIADPNRLWLPDSSASAVLRYDALDGLAARVGYRSMRRPGETWEAFAARIERLPPRAWPAVARESYHTGLGALDPTARDAFESLVAAARAAGFRVRVAETYRAPERQAYLLAHGNGRTMTATSPHLYGRAADILVGDGRIDRPAKVREWIRFRRWVLDWGQGRFRLVGRASSTWDWPHVELADEAIGYRTVDELLAAARLCLAGEAPSAPAGSDPCALPRDAGARARILAAARAAAPRTVAAR